MLSALVGYATQVPLVGPSDVSSDTPPKLVMQTIDGNEVAFWDDISRFGPVPKSKMAAAEEIRASIGASGPRGSQLMAMEINGNPLEGGGYLCRFD